MVRLRVELWLRLPVCPHLSLRHASIAAVKTPADGRKLLKKGVDASAVKKAGSSSKGKSARKECVSRPQQSPAPGQSSTADVAAVLKEAFSSSAEQINKGFGSLGKLLKVKNDAKGDESPSALFDSESDDIGGGSDIDPENWQHHCCSHSTRNFSTYHTLGLNTL